MLRRTIAITVSIAAFGTTGVATASAATPHHRQATTRHATTPHHHRRHRHARIHVRHRVNVTRAGAHHDPIAVTALGVHHTGDPIAVAA